MSIYHVRYRKLIKYYRENPVSGYSERHHIKPKCLGGGDDASNIVDLPARAHYIAHVLLTKMYPTNNKIHYALACMAQYNDRSLDRQKYLTSSRRYSRIRKSLAIARSKSCVIDGVEYCSITDAAKKFNVCRSTIRKWILCGGKSLPVLGEEIVVIDGKSFKSRKAAAKFYGVTYSTIKDWVNKGTSKSRRIKTKVIINGTEFESVYKASIFYGVDRKTIRQWVSNDYWKTDKWQNIYGK